MGKRRMPWLLAAIGGLLLATPVYAMPFSDGSGIAMQRIIDDLDGFTGVDAVDDLLPVETTSSFLAGSTTFTVVAERANFKDRNSFGVYSGTRMVDLFEGEAEADDTLRVEMATLRSMLGSETFGFYLKSPQGWFFSDPVKNVDGLEHMVAYRGVRDLLLGFEDLSGGGDRDFDDFVVRISGDGTSAAPVPEPGTLLLLGSGMLGLAFARKARR